MSLTGIEKNFVKEWSGWDEHDTGVLAFTGIVLQDNIRALLHTNGADVDDIDYMCVDTQNSQVEFLNSAGTESYTFQLVASLGARIV